MAGGIDSIPDELLQDIFLCNLRSRHKVSGCHAAETRCKPPWVYAAVSRRWRSVATCYGALWCDLKISIPDKALSSEDGVKALDAILKRSSGRTLSLTISNLTIDPCTDTLKLLYNVEQRWQSVKLYTLTSIDISSHVTSWSALTSIELDFSVSLPSAFPTVLDLSKLTKLRSYTERTFQNIGTKVLLPLQSVESIEIQMRNEDTHCRLGYAPALQRLHIDNTVYIPLDLDHLHLADTVGEEPLFPLLRELHLRNADCILRHVQFAQLTKLFIYMGTRIWAFANGEANMSYLSCILAASRTTLVSLYLSGHIDWQHKAFREPLLSLQSLHTLQIGVSLSRRSLGSLAEVEDFVDQVRYDFIDLLRTEQSPRAVQFVLVCRVFGLPTQGQSSTAAENSLGSAIMDLVKGLCMREKVGEVYLHGADNRGFGRMFRIEPDGAIVENSIGTRFILHQDGSVTQEPIERT